MGKKDVNKEIDKDSMIALIETIKENLSELKGIIEALDAEKPEESEKSGESKESKIVVGSLVKWDDDGDDQEGEVIKIKGDIATVEDDNGDEHKVDLEDLTLVSAKKTESKPDKKASKIEVGSEVEWEDDKGDDQEGEVIKIKGDIATVEDDNGDKHKVDLADLKLA